MSKEIAIVSKKSDLADTLSGPLSTSDEELEKPWGTIKSLLDQQNFDLFNKSFSVGGMGCDWTIFSTTELPISGIHCKNKKMMMKSGCQVAFIKSQRNVFTFVNNHEESFGLPIKIVNRFDSIKSLGSGSYGDVYLVIDRKTNEKFALKHVRKKKPAHLIDNSEVIISQEINHDHVLHCLEAIESENKTYMLFDVMEGGNLHEFLNSQGYLSENLAKFYFTQICLAVKYIHDKNIVHCDIKLADGVDARCSKCKLIQLCPLNLSVFIFVRLMTCVFRAESKGYFEELLFGNMLRQSLNDDQYNNISVEAFIIQSTIDAEDFTKNLLRLTDDTNTTLKLCDFGLSRKFDANATVSTKCGSTLYASPELLSRHPFSPKTDIWSLGVTLYAMLSGTLPFKSVTSIQNGIYNFDNINFENVSDSAKQLIKKMLDVKPDTRLSIEDVLLNEWISDQTRN